MRKWRKCNADSTQRNKKKAHLPSKLGLNTHVAML